MTLTHSELTFFWTPTTVILGILFVTASLILSSVIWKRNQFSVPQGLLEFLRCLIVTLVALTLNQPEWRESFEPEESPVIAVLHDISGSMETRDVIERGRPEKEAKTRTKSVSNLIKESAWTELGQEFDIKLQSFSSEGEVTEATDISSALSEAADQFPNLRSVVLISDGDWNTGNPPSRAATQLRIRKVPIFAIPVGSETRLPDLEVTAFDPPSFGLANKPLRLPFTLSSSLSRAHSTAIEIRSDKGESITYSVDIPAMGKIQDAILWTPKSEGNFELSLRLPPIPEEHSDANNLLTAPIVIRREELKILLIDSFPRWEYRYIRNALVRDPGVEVSCLLFHPDSESLGGGTGYLTEFPSEAKISDFDVIFLGDVGIAPDQLSIENVTALKQHISNQAAGLVLMPGFRGFQQTLLETSLEPLFPVIMDTTQPRGWGSSTPGQFELTDLGARSLLTRLEDTENANTALWSSLPGFQWFAGVSRAKAGAEVLATHSSDMNQYGRIPLIITKTFGTGKILFMGTDGAWRWRKGVEDKYHYRFWGQVARWMSYQRNMASDKLMRLFYSPDRPKTGDTLTLNANVMSIGGEPLKSATVVVQIVSPSGKVDSVRLQSGREDQWGLFTGIFEPTEPGEHLITMTCSENEGMIETTLMVQGTNLEIVGNPARIDVMEELARITRGKIIREADLNLLRSSLSTLPEPEPLEKRLRLWAHPLWITLLILLMTTFWIGRKVVGSV
ncbi:MAG: hypothetical protein CMO61_02605 [Verrucomicrobiales bacterium]|nr:hypothetical protein [Verrucomicrobiales bacterium]